TPFGSPDAATEGHWSVPRSIPGMPSSLAKSANGMARVFVGRVGSGKTRCLLDVMRRLRTESTGVVTPVDFDLPSLTFITRAAEGFIHDPRGLADMWERLWKRAIVRSALCHVLTNPGLLPDDPDTRALSTRVREQSRTIGHEYEVPRSIFAEF